MTELAFFKIRFNVTASYVILMLIKMINQIFGIVEIEFILIAKRYVIALIGFNAAQENN